MSKQLPRTHHHHGQPVTTNYHPRWQEDENGVLKPLISRIHVIPLEGEAMLHCAQVTCWCSPVMETGDIGQFICNHTQATGEASGWVLIGELDHSDVEQLVP